MPLPSFIQRLRQRSPASVADASPLSSADIELARVRARRRLVGMVVLVGAGVIGFPWLFETQPRPVSGDIQVVSAMRSGGSVASVASGARPAIAAVTVPTLPREQPAPTAEDADAVKAVPVPAKSDRPAVHAPTVNTPKPVAEVAVPTPPRPVASPAAKGVSRAAADQDASRVKALLDGKAAAASTADAATTRYVVQIGAFADVPAAHEVRLKAERLGIKTYTQVVATASGKRIRVRVGPFTSKAEADKALAALRKAGLSSALLTL
ncbi:MAG: SPOR domain-containing protein [Burkholderiales bacterium]|nr:SPOR domain-containing protein [Burkholderiales bacterium]